MKRIIKHPEPKEGDLVGPRYWKSLDDLAETPEFKTWLEREFPAGAAEAEGVNRRHFMKIMAASFGLAGMGVAGCRRPEFHIRPYGRQPENLIPGVPNFYSSSMPGARENLPLVVETHQARPTKVEGNPSYEPTGGKTNQYAQASVLNLYDPDRMKRSESDGNRIAPKAVRDQLDAIGRAATANDGKGVAFLAEPSTSPSRQRLVNSLLERAPQAIWAEYEAIDRGVAERALGGLIGEGARVRPLYDFAEAKRILSVDCDFLGQEDGAVQYTRGFAKTRKVAGAEEASKMSRLYAVESDFTLTGAAADHRLRLSGVYMTAFISRLAAKVFEEAGMAADLVNLMRDHASGLPVDPAWIDACAADLFEHQGHALVTAGSHLPEEAQVLVAAINEVLGANGSTVSYLRLPDSPAKTLAELASALQSGEVETLIILGGNPAYDAPAGLNFVELLKSVPRVIRHSYNFDDTSELASENIAASHYLESWSDGRALDGTIVPVQPMIEPLFETVSELEFLARTTAASETDSYAIVRATLDPLLGGTGEQATNRFNTFLAEGTAADTAYPQAELPAMSQSVRAASEQIDVPSTALGLDNLECRFAPSAQVADGRYNNNGWLLEMPEPMTKLTWDNAILISPRLARQLEDKWQVQIIPGGGVINAELWGRFKINKNKAKFNRGKEMAPLAELTLGGKTIKAPIHVQPGLPNHTVVLPLGWGRARSGRVGEGVGFNFYPLRESGAAFAHGAQIKVLDEYYKLANTQEHWSMEGRAIVREATVDDFKKKPDFVDSMGMESHSPPIYGKSKDKSIEYKALNQPRGSSLYKTPDFGAPPPNVDAWKSEEAKEKFIPPQQWGMTIDLNSCTGCNACVIACQSENNIPIVGKNEVLRGREMHWIRLDRYYASATGEEPSEETGGIPEDPQVAFQGMACQHCELAPCESVCPVNATVHDEQGLNVMAYNRCVGTRYCANNCPYKVRRFNFFDWQKRDINRLYEGPLGPVDVPETEKMQHNPDVTVRMRGVMEKCTYCVQRIEAAKIKFKARAQDSNNTRIPDGYLKVACQQACPAEAIEFGDISDPDSAVYKSKQNPRDYSVLGYLNVRPRTTYLARLRNPNPKMPERYAYAQPYTRQNYEERYGHGTHHEENGHGKATHAAPAHNGEHSNGTH